VEFGARGSCLASLLAWNTSSDEKVFALIPLNQERMRRFLELLSSTEELGAEKRWQSIQSELAKLRLQAEGDITVVKCQGPDNRILGSVEVEARESGVRDQIGQNVETALSARNVDKWLQIFPM
jgi:hypothetical protein